MWQAYYEVVRHVERLTLHQWTVVFIVAIAIGVFCMRGFGSRSAG
jgi:hypothetical protein